jgi:hypothetical protein
MVQNDILRQTSCVLSKKNSKRYLLVMSLAGIGNILHSTSYVMVGCAVLAVITLFTVNKK